jgi:formyltetrahydrofolate deformylase
MKHTAILLIECPDQRGLVAAIGEFLYRHNANILHADQHQDAERNLFLMRVEWDLEGFDLGREETTHAFTPVAERFGMRWRMEWSDRPHRIALFVSKYDHCLVDLLYRHQSGELPCDMAAVISNHPDAQRWADF